MEPAVDSTLDVAVWFLDRALNHNEYLQPQKLQRLLFLAQAYYAVAYDGGMLMPAVFVADEVGPMEPNVYRQFENGRPYNVEARPVPAKVHEYLDSIWRKFGPLSADVLSRQVRQHGPYAEARAAGLRTVITLAAMRGYYGQKAIADKGQAPMQQVIRPRVMRTQTGRPGRSRPGPRPPSRRRSEGGGADLGANTSQRTRRFPGMAKFSPAPGADYWPPARAIQDRRPGPAYGLSVFSAFSRAFFS